MDVIYIVCVVCGLCVCVECGLIPRPSHCPVFDHLQYTKTEGEGLGSLMMSISI